MFRSLFREIKGVGTVLGGTQSKTDDGDDGLLLPCELKSKSQIRLEGVYSKSAFGNDFIQQMRSSHL